MFGVKEALNSWFDFSFIHEPDMNVYYDTCEYHYQAKEIDQYHQQGVLISL